MGRNPKSAKLGEAAIPSQQVNFSCVHPQIEKSDPARGKHSSTLLKRKMASKDKSMILRRSGRLQSVFQPAQGKGGEMVIEQINLVESDKDDDTNLEDTERENEPLVEAITTEPITVEKNLEEKIDQLIEDVEQLKSKESKRNSSDAADPISSSEHTYRTLYIHSQKKIEELTKENGQLSNQLQVAQAKIEVYENVKDVMDKMKEFVVASNLTKAAEAMLNISSKSIFAGASNPSASVEPDPKDVPGSPAKRKRGNKGAK